MFTHKQNLLRRVFSCCGSTRFDILRRLEITKDKCVQLGVGGMLLLGWGYNPPAFAVDLQSSQTVSFPQKKPSKYTITSPRSLTVNVDRSASALIIPFDEAQSFKRLSFAYKLSGELRTKDAL